MKRISLTLSGQSIDQEPGQLVQSFLAKLKSKARPCDMKLTCCNLSCKTVNSYRDAVILSLFINGSYNRTSLLCRTSRWTRQ